MAEWIWRVLVGQLNRSDTGAPQQSSDRWYCILDLTAALELYCVIIAERKLEMYPFPLFCDPPYCRGLQMRLTTIVLQWTGSTVQTQVRELCRRRAVVGGITSIPLSPHNASVHLLSVGRLKPYSAIGFLLENGRPCLYAD